jgi:hypothetical protein
MEAVTHVLKKIRPWMLNAALITALILTGVYLDWEFHQLMAAVVFATLFLWSLPSRTSAPWGIMCLVCIPIFRYWGKDLRAEQAALFAFVLLSVAVFNALSEYISTRLKARYE